MKRFSLSTLIVATLLVVLVSLLSACGSSYDPNDTVPLGLPSNTTPVQQIINSSSGDTNSQQVQPSSDDTAPQQLQGFYIVVSSISFTDAQGNNSYGQMYSQQGAENISADNLSIEKFFFTPGELLSNFSYSDPGGYYTLAGTIDLSNNTITNANYSYTIRSGVIANGTGGNGGTASVSAQFSASIQTF